MIFFGLTLPAFLFGSLLALLLGAAVHFWQGGNWKYLLLYISISWFGFWIGHFLAKALNWTFFQLGPVNLLIALFGDLLGLAFALWLVRSEKVSN